MRNVHVWDADDNDRQDWSTVTSDMTNRAAQTAWRRSVCECTRHGPPGRDPSSADRAGRSGAHV